MIPLSLSLSPLLKSNSFEIYFLKPSIAFSAEIQSSEKVT
jgi:hypothetical protein